MEGPTGQPAGGASSISAGVVSERQALLRDSWVIGPTFATRWFWAKVASRITDPTPLMRGTAKPRRPIVLEVESGDRPGDFVWNGLMLIVASERVLEVFRGNDFSGFSTYPVALKARGRRLPGYHGFSVLGRAGAIDYARSGVEWFVEPDGSRRTIHTLRRLHFDASNWNGNDIYCVDDILPMIVTGRVAKALCAAKITNYDAVAPAKFHF